MSKQANATRTEDRPKPVLGAREPVTVVGQRDSTRVEARIDTGAPRTYVDVGLACAVGAGPLVGEGTFRGSNGAAERLIVELEVDVRGTIHVVEAMAQLDIDISDRTPREVTPDELQAVDLVVTMGCSASDVCPAWNGENRDWGLNDPHERPIEEVREIRNEIEERVVELFNKLLSETPPAE